MNELLPIGRFGKESQLSPRQLRYYHARGLLVPAAVNPDSGYRYYASAQLATAELIALLRTADMPVADIQALLADRSPANVRAIFERLRAGVEQKLERARAILDQIHELEDAAMPSDQQATYAFTAFAPDAQQALERAQALAEESHHSTIAVAHLIAAQARADPRVRVQEFVMAVLVMVSVIRASPSEGLSGIWHLPGLTRSRTTPILLGQLLGSLSPPMWRRGVSWSVARRS